MAIIRWDPFREFDRFFDDDWGLVPMVRGMRGMIAHPRIDVYQTENEVVAEVEVPAGIDPEKIEISVENGVLAVRGEMEEEKEEDRKRYHRREIRKESFARSVTLPVNVKGEGAEAVCEKGVLKVTLPKAEEAKQKMIQVKVKK